MIQRPVSHALRLCAIILCTGITDISAQHVDICYFGDSITEGWIDGSLRSSEAYPALSDSILRTAGGHSSSRNLGKGGETSDDAIMRIDRDVLALRPRIVVLAFGNNDWFVWGSPPFQRVPNSLYRSNLSVLIEKIQGSGAHPVLLGLPPVLAGRFHQFFSEELYTPFGGVLASNAMYDETARTLAMLRSVPFVSARWDTGLDSLLGIDGVHLSPAGHKQIAQELAVQLQQLLDSSTSTVIPSAPSVYPVPFQRDIHNVLRIAMSVDANTVVQIRIFDVTGREIRKIVSLSMSGGRYIVPWDGRCKNGTPASQGAYTISVLAGCKHSHHTLLIL